MLVRIHLRKGHKVARRSGKNRNVAFTSGALLKPIALTAYVVGLWRLMSDMGLAGEFVFTGMFSHWQIWMGLGALAHIASSVLARYGTGGELRWPKILSLRLRPLQDEPKPAEQNRMAAGR
jgi:hypothetical protein